MSHSFAVARMRQIVALALVLCAVAPVWAIEAVRIDTPITLDGKLDEAAWQLAIPSETFFENMPNEKQPARVRTQARVLYDDVALYVGVRAFDPDPSQIVAPFVRRDKVFGSMDNFVLWIDPTGARKFAQFFRVNPRGVLADGVWSEDLSDESFAPDFDYEAVPMILSDGWSAEFRIPWSTLRVPSPLPAQMNFMLFRNMMRETRIRMSNVPLGREPSCFLCVAEPLTGIRDLKPSAGFSVSPYVSAIAQKQGRERNTDVNVGADLKWRASASWVIDATLLPDFSQLEIDAPQLKGNSQFALSFPEKRPFFMEGSDLFGAPFNLVYTRAIGDPRWGVRATQRDEKLDATVFTIADRGRGVIVVPGTFSSQFDEQPRSQVTLARARVPFAALGSTGSIAGLLTDRRYDNDVRNTVLSVDGLIKPNDPTRFRAQLAASETTTPNDSVRGHVWFADGQYADGVTNVYARAQGVSPTFRADVGFVPQNGYHEYSTEMTRCFTREGFISQWCPSVNGFRKETWSGKTLTQIYTPVLFVNGQRSMEWSVQPRWFYDTRVREGGRLHHTPTIQSRLFFVPNQTFTLMEVNFEAGRAVDVISDSVERLLDVSATLNTRIHPRVETELRGGVFQLSNRANGDSRLKEHFAQLVIVGHVSASDTVRVIAQTTQSTRNLALYPNGLGLSPGGRSRAISAVYAKRWGLNKELSIGATTATQEADAPSTVEGFVKLVWTFAR